MHKFRKGDKVKVAFGSPENGKFKHGIFDHYGESGSTGFFRHNESNKMLVRPIEAFMPDSEAKPVKPKSISHITVTTTSTEIPLGATRADLMQQAREQGIKYFRILNRVELAQVLNRKKHNDQVAIDVIISKAKERWQAGWGKRKDQTK